MHCKNCGIEYKGKECPQCGELAIGMMKCASCHEVIPLDSVVCPRCGAMSTEHFGVKSSVKMHIKAYEAWSIFSGLVSLALSVFVFADADFILRSGDAGAANSAVYVLTAVLLLLSGVVSIIRHHADSRVLFFTTVTYGLCGFLCLVQMFRVVFSGASLIAWWSLICCVVSVVSALRR